jgi:hypothetical protein
VTEKRLRFSFEGPEDAKAALPFHMQGDFRFNEGDMLQARQKLKERAPIRKEVLEYWSLFSKGSTNSGSVSSVNKSQFLSFLVKVFKALRQKDFDESTALACAERCVMCRLCLRFLLHFQYHIHYMIAINSDWEYDSSNSEFMVEEDFFNSLFELCDNWYQSVDLFAPSRSRFGFLQVLQQQMPTPSSL